MRILVVSKGYPPSDRDDYALGCQDVVESLKERGHRIQVLTSAPRLRKYQKDGDIHRWLMKDRQERSKWQTAFLKEVVNQASMKTLLRDFQPHIVFLFDLSQISVSLSLLAQDSGPPVCFYVPNEWLAMWEADRWYQEQPKGTRGYNALRFLIRRFKIETFLRPLDFGRIIFTSRYLETAAGGVGKSAAHTTVVPWGVDTRRFSYGEARGRNPARLLYRGPIRPQKGIDVAIQALGILKKEPGFEALSMTIAGVDKAFSDYIPFLHDLAASSGVLKNVTFADYAPDQMMPDLYRTHDIFVFPSAIVEPLTISVLEAMSCGLGIVSTATGGNAEVLKDEFNALVIPGENPESCARQIRRLLKDPALFETLRAQARRTIEERFELAQAIDSIEQVLKDAVGQAETERQPVVSEERPLIPEWARLKSLADLADRAREGLIWGSLLVQARNLVRPKLLNIMLKLKIQKTFAYVGLLVFPPLYKWLFKLTGRRPKKPQTDADHSREVLVVQLADLGDIILTGPFLRELRRFLPRSKIVLVVHPGMVNVVEKCPYIDEVRLFDYRTEKGWKDAFQGDIRWWLKTLWPAVRGLSKDHFDMAISLRWNNDASQAASLILLYSSGAPRRIAYIDGLNDYKLFCRNNVNHLITQGPTRGAPKHEIEYQREFLDFLGVHPEETRLEVWTTPEDERFAQNVLDRHGVTAKDLLIAFAPGAGWSYRRWPASRFIELGRWLQENHQAHILLFAGKTERKLVHEIEKGLRDDRTVNLAGLTTYREMAAVLRSCKFLLGNDSGPLHVAAAAGVTVIGLFGPGEYERFRPWGSDHEIIRLGLTCNPCSEYCQFHDALCIRGIAVSQVQKVFSEKLQRKSKPSPLK